MIAFATTGIAVFLGSLFISPPLPPSQAVLKKEIRAIQEHVQEARAHHDASWQRYVQKTSPGNSKPPPRPAPHDQSIRLGYLLSPDPESLEALALHAGQLTHVATQSLSMPDVEADILVEQDKETESAVRRSRLPRVAILENYNAAGDFWVPEAVEYLAFGPQGHRKDFIAKLISSLNQLDASAVLLDWQEIDPAYQPEITALLRDLSVALHAKNLELWLKISVGDDLNAFDISSLSPHVDHFVAALHDENGQDDEAGPIASPEWFSGWIQALLCDSDPAQWIVELGAYGYDWDDSSHHAEEITFADAMTRARFSGADDIAVAAPDFNPSFSYSENGHTHTVWFLDGITFFNEWSLARKLGIADVAVHHLGGEDPAVWNVIASAGTPGRVSLSSLEAIPGSPQITHVGQGEIVSVENLEDSRGKRNVKKAGDGQLTAQYTDFPTYPTLFHTGGALPGRVAITFDDGPDPEWTPQILDILRKHHAHATFFVLGANAENEPSLLRRIVAEGHELGSHTFTHGNLAMMPDSQIKLELNATQRVIQNATGRSTVLFRPPYDADSRPEELAQLRPLQVAQNLGYLTVLERIDPQDWDLPGTEEIIRRVQASVSEGTVLLLHDAGGTRKQTVEALPKILDFFARQGVKVVSIADLLGTTRDELMPPVAGKDTEGFADFVSNLGFLILRLLGNTVWFLIVAATFLVALRTIIILVLALLHRRKKTPFADYAPPLSIIVPAFKEGRVIAATLEALLQSDYPAGFEILIVDDGSPDDTFEEAGRIAARDGRVRVLRQTNSGKANALENGMRQATNDIVVFLDADTHFMPDTLRHLVAPLADPRVGAVAGHPRVGNPRTLIARCQDIEYLMAFNLDRRALSVWNAVTVVPGAVSAFRRQAILDAGGFSHDTLAEDTDLTLAIHKAGWRMECAPRAIARTEAPEAVRPLVKQRFRWALGTMQCIWKHRRQTFSRENFALGWFSLPGVWLFQILLVACAPLIDLLFIQSAIMGRWEVVLPYFLIFLACDLVLAFVACRMESLSWSHALRVIPMRFIYRPILSFVVWRAIGAALRGAWVGWSKLDRTGTVVTPAIFRPS